VLLVNDLRFSDKVEKFQERLLKKYGKDYSIKEIEKELEILKVENDFMWEKAKSGIVEYPEDYYEGY
jgi:hypothetical protein